MPKEDKEVYEKQYQEEKEEMKIMLENKAEKTLTYKLKLEKYIEDQNREKDEILEKFKLHTETIADFQSIHNFLKNEKNERKRECRRRMKEEERRKEEKRIKENGLKLMLLLLRLCLR